MWEGGARGIKPVPRNGHAGTCQSDRKSHCGNSRLCNYQAYQPFENNDAKIAVTLYSIQRQLRGQIPRKPAILVAARAVAHYTVLIGIGFMGSYYCR